MRRLLVAAMLLSTVTVPAHAAAPATRPAAHAPGRHTLALTTGRAWLDQQYDLLAGDSKPAYELLKKIDARPAGSTEIEGATSWPVGDLDGDRLPDVAILKFDIVIQDFSFTISGDYWLTIRNGRTGAVRWKRAFLDRGFIGFADVPVGADARTGILVVEPYEPSKDQSAHRMAGISGRTGKTVWSQTVSSEDGLGQVYWGGLFDAYYRGGMDLLFGRVTTPTPLGVHLATPWTVDGRDGKIRTAHPQELVVGDDVSYLAAGDLDGDNRDDFLRIRADGQDFATVTAYSVVEDKTLWERSNVPMGWDVGFLYEPGPDLVATRNEDVLFSTYTGTDPLIPGVTDTLPLVGGPGAGQHLVVLDGANGDLVTNRVLERGFVVAGPDANGDRKRDIYAAEMTEPKGKPGIRLGILNGRGRVLFRREVSMDPPLGATGSFRGVGLLGDYDGDGIGDFYYAIGAYSELQSKMVEGMVLTRGNKVVPVHENLYPMGGTLDGGTYERVRVKQGDGTRAFTFLDGMTTRPYWSLSVAGPAKTSWGLGMFPGARGRCDDVVLFGAKSDGSAVSYWMDVLDGATGRRRWSLTLWGHRPPTTVRATGPRAPCR